MNQAHAKVLFLITKATWGGAQKYVYDLTTHLPRDEFGVVVAYGEKGRLVGLLEEDGIETVQIKSLVRDVGLFNDWKSFCEIKKILQDKKYRPDVLHLNSSKAAALGALAGRLCGVKRIIFTAHGWPFGEQRDPLSRALIYFFSWLTALCAHKIIVVSEYDLKVAQKMPFIGHKTTRIYNGIDLNFPLYSAHVVRESFPNGVKITGTIGELTKNKNQIMLIEQAKKDPSMYVAIVGEGEDRSYLKRKIEEYNLDARVKLFGFMLASRVLKEFDVFALPSIKEGLPYVLLEARAAGLPIIANRVGGVGEILDATDLQKFSMEQMVKQTTALY